MMSKVMNTKMDDIPVDISNKKFVTIEPKEETIIESPQGPINPSTPNVKKPRHSRLKRIPKIKIKIDVDEFKSSLRNRVEHFQKVQYPYIYAKAYDFYQFNLVGYKPLDVFLKVLILLTMLILFGILLYIFKELLNLLF